MSELMKSTKTDRGFGLITHPTYGETPETDARLVQCSSAIDFDSPNGLNHPGSSYLWVGDRHHLNKAEVACLVGQLEHWLEYGEFYQDKIPSVDKRDSHK